MSAASTGAGADSTLTSDSPSETGWFKIPLRSAAQVPPRTAPTLSPAGTTIPEEDQMRSYVRSLLMVTVLSAPLATLAADSVQGVVTPRSAPRTSNCPCSMPRDAVRPDRAHHARTMTGDRLEEGLGGRHGVPNSFDSPG